MVGIAAISAMITTEESQQAVVAPSPATNRMTQEVVVAKDPKAIAIASLDRCGYFLCQFRTDTLIRVQNQDPLMRRLGDRPILEITRVNIFTLNNPTAAHGIDDFQRPVARTGVCDEDLIGELPDRVNTMSDIHPFILARNDDSDPTGHEISPEFH